MTFITVIALLTPLLVTLVVCRVARREGSSLPTGALMRLTIGTLAALAALLYWTHPLAVLVTTLVLFVLLAIPVMHELERTAKERLREEPVRAASLAPRSIATYVPSSARTATAIAGLALLTWVVARAADGPKLATVGFAFAGVVFFGLYETWMRQEVFSVRAVSDEERRARVRGIFGAQSVLTIVFLLLAGLSAGDWPGFVVVAGVAAPAGIVGCALALSTGIQERYLEAWSVKH